MRANNLMVSMSPNNRGGVQHLSFKDNGLNLIRLLAALQVFYGHAVAHLELTEVSFVTRVFTMFMGVPIFFFISGYLMWKSIDRTSNIKNYFTKRVLRLYPELWCGVAVSLITIFVLYDGVVLRDVGLFAITQSTFMQFWTPDSLRGFGVGTPNGSLWTICVIVQFYIVAWFIKKVVAKHNTIVSWTALLSVLTLVNVLSPWIQGFLSEIIRKLYGQTVLPYLWLFMLGAFTCEYFDKIVPALKRLWWIIPIIFYILKWIHIDIPGSYPVLSSVLSCAFCISFAYAFPHIPIKHDISYGIYIYHMIVINVALELGFKGSWGVCAVVLFITLLLATSSYFTLAIFCKKRKEKLEL